MATCFVGMLWGDALLPLYQGHRGTLLARPVDAPLEFWTQAAEESLLALPEAALMDPAQADSVTPLPRGIGGGEGQKQCSGEVRGEVGRTKTHSGMTETSCASCTGHLPCKVLVASAKGVVTGLAGKCLPHAGEPQHGRVTVSALGSGRACPATVIAFCPWCQCTALPLGVR